MSVERGIEERWLRNEQKITSLVGKRLVDVTYWDVNPLGQDLPKWDYGDWHLAVMGVEIHTDQGPVSLRWSGTLPNGVEVFAEPMSRHFFTGPDGPVGWNVGDHPFWEQKSGSTIRGVATHWEKTELGNSRSSDGTLNNDARTFVTPAALRLDFDSDPV